MSEGPKYAKCRKNNVTYLSGFFRGATPLMIACNTGNAKMVSFLIERGALVNKTDSLGLTTFAFACSTGHLQICKILRRNGALIEVRDDKFGMSPLHIACRMGHTVVAKWLVANGANVHVSDYNGRSPLHFAAWTSNIQLIEFLVGKSVNLNSKDKNGNTPLHYAVSNDAMIPVNVETEYFSPYELETASNITSQVSSITEYELSVEIHRREDRENEDSRYTDVWFATFLLIKSGAYMNAVNYKGETPLHVLTAGLPECFLSEEYVIVYQAKLNQELLVQMLVLLKLGADTETLSNDSKSAIDNCRENENYLAYKILNNYANLPSAEIAYEQSDLVLDMVRKFGMKYAQKVKVIERQLEQLSDLVIEPPSRRSFLEMCRLVMGTVHRFIDEVIVG